MKINPITVIIIASVIYPILRGIIFGFSAYNAKRDIASIGTSISFALAIYIGVKYLKNIFIVNEHNVINKIAQILPDKLASSLQSNPVIIYVLALLLIIYLIYKLIEIIIIYLISFTIYQVIDKIESSIRNKNFVLRRIIGALIEIPRAICYLLVVLLFLNVASMISSNRQFNNYLSTSNIYGYFCKQFVTPITNSNVAKKLPQIIGDSVKVVVRQGDTNNVSNGENLSNTIVYYNGVTLDQAVKSNESIDNFSKKVVHGYSGTIDKAKALYDWEGSSITYDYNKASSVLNNDYDVKSGAIPTFDTRTGICFDYASLYVAMCRANNIKVRLVTGEGFNGVNWISHAWNMVYLPETKEWINVDTTFAKGGNYFNNKMFDLDHRNAKIIGEW
ncbi:Transglutaminase-like superfamily protein [Clostridium acidisoli DSM 12555]|uniref:Transglutaminase-like superfamily protein n=1 Tax=Clostridium acidisoli DSM 12555 TaxID=1121291 RepID=A0A1W1XAE7_9CLOT|nr:transglutaminase-like domain-containing protein [Clostridium acidisoli]SMC20754.1 Transglutaminase-like superfamily protein [Clostridium acidisoli DSM 12555]